MLLTYLLQGSEEEVGVSRESIDAFVQTLRRDFPRGRVPVVLAPLIYREQEDITEDRYTIDTHITVHTIISDSLCVRFRLIPVSVSLPSSVLYLADIMKDIGYSATASKQDVLEILKDFGKSQITPKQVARVLGMMASTLSGLPEGVPFLGVSGEVTSHGAGKAPTTWDVKNFVAAVQTLVSTIILASSGGH